MKWIVVLCFNACFCFSACAEQTVRITSGADPYVIELLKHALSYQREVHTLDFVENIPTQNRAIRLLGDKNGIDVFWSVTSDEREKQALAVRVPIVKGLLGYRLGVIKKSRLDYFAKLKTDGELRGLSYGLRADWPDTVIFKDNDFNVLEYSQENAGYELLEASRIDVLPIDALYANDISNMTNLTIAPAHVFYYTSAVYFFVNKNNKALYQKLKSGLDKAIEDGSFDTLFNHYFESELTELALDKRQKITLVNTLLPASAPIHTKKYWYNQNQGK
ncbi:transporter substrate-binding domain-containing protein [Pseudoalteromonas sp. BZB3]|uniref:substrate-binding periplasmic protein n=1 Tax=Pseudoalteromonas sp. BZB3 TaxID=3136670 RepID=UPI0032C3F94B